MENKKLTLVGLLLLAGLIYLAHRQIQRNSKLLVLLFDYDKELALKDREIEELKKKLKIK
jgi:hypothetical protein